MYKNKRCKNNGGNGQEEEGLDFCLA